GFTVVDTENSFEALDYLDSATPDLIILDIMMPGMNGIDLCRRIRSRPTTSETPIIIFSALGDEKTINSALAAGADRYLHKLNLFGDLVSTVESTLSRKAHRHAPSSETPQLRVRRADAFNKPAV
ncbi:MAG: response regulator, partial [Anaerolineae bacterium]|nr:response regulator [Anaerolineae bacterium]